MGSSIEYRKEHYAKNRERILEELRIQRQADPEKFRRFEREQYEKHRQRRMESDEKRAQADPRKRAAKFEVNRHVAEGKLPKASSGRCLACGNKAKDYHHQSYAHDDKLNVIPLCRSCHVLLHSNSLSLPPLGVVVLNIGIVRIAIAGE